jgi:polyphosphate kinase
MTANEEIGADVNDVFTQLTGLGKATKLKHLWEAPFTLHKQVLAAIQREIAHARAGRKAHLIAKMNALVEPQVIAALYEASKAGVRIDLIVRGVCALRPGIPEISHNIRVRSIVGRFLEHARVFCFHNDGADDVYLSSADWMPRNFFRRVEVCFPIYDPKLKKRVVTEGLLPYIEDNSNAWEMDEHGAYHRADGRAAGLNAQQTLLDRLATAQPT